MGMIRKTLSIGTLGLVSFRSKSEKLQRTEATLGVVAADRDLERVGRVEAEARAAAAQVQLKLAKREAAVARKRLSKVRKRGKSSRTLAEMGELTHDAAVAGKKLGRRARHDAAVAGKKLGRRGRKMLKQSQTTATEHAKHYAESAHAVVSDALDR